MSELISTPEITSTPISLPAVTASLIPERLSWSVILIISKDFSFALIQFLWENKNHPNGLYEYVNLFFLLSFK